MRPFRYAVAVMAAVLAVHLYADPRHIDPRAYLEHIKYLASDELEGRGDGAPGLEKAADYIGKSFGASGLEPAGDNGTFFQKFELVAGLSIEPGNSVTFKTPRRVGLAADRARLRPAVDVVGPSVALAAPGRVCRIRHLRGAAWLRRLCGPRCGGQGRPDFYARAAGKRPGEPLRRPDQHRLLVGRAQGGSRRARTARRPSCWSTIRRTTRRRRSSAAGCAIRRRRNTACRSSIFRAIGCSRRSAPR